ncbi:MAG TPA: Gfo/Idh/MocA family oxidoreductase [Methylovirgula sp.]|nr:Gfo/Idh/MocA family oxidoreductase [Methylovirgula sp.]
MRFAIIGCGFIGQKRAAAIGKLGHEIALAIDISEPRARELAERVNATAASDYRRAQDTDIDAAVIATSHAELSPIATALLSAGKHVLVEKPGGRNLTEVRAIAEAAKSAGRIAKIGYNHRFHPAVLEARAIVDAGDLGTLMFIRGRYGHGGRPGYEKEWRFRREVSGGGELIDQGSHLVDLAHWFLGDFEHVQGTLRTFFWNADVEDNAFLTLSTRAGQVAWLHATWTEWKNMFCLEIYGRDGKLQIDGLGGSYGLESLTHYRMLPGMGPPETTRWEYPFPDRSWEAETAEFISAIAEKRRPIGDALEAVGSMSVIERIYKGEPS